MMIAKEKKWKIELKKKKITLMLALSINWMQMTMIIRRTVPMTMGRTVALKTKRYELRGMRRIVTAMSMKMRIMGMSQYRGYFLFRTIRVECSFVTSLMMLRKA